MVWQQILIVLVAFLGLPIGFLIAYFAHDELKEGRVLFKLLRIVMLLSIAFFLAFNYKISSVLLVPALFVLLFTILTSKRTNLMKELAGYLFLLLSLIATFFVEDTQLTFVTASLIFVYLLASAAVLKEPKKEKMKWK